MNLGVNDFTGFTVVFKSFGGPLILKLTPKTPSPTFLPIKKSPNTGIEAIVLFIVEAGTKVPLKLISSLDWTYPSIKIEIDGPIAYSSSIVIIFSLFENFISKSVNLIPSPVNRSAIPCKDARVNILAKTGISWTLKLSILRDSFIILEILSLFSGCKIAILSIKFLNSLTLPFQLWFRIYQCKLYPI